jgi:Protein of unknown function (DUF2723)
MRSRPAAALAAAISFVASFAVYLKTLAPAVAFIDSGELTLAAARLGIPHPPGFPTWTMLTHVFTWIPIDTVAWRTNLASAFFSSLAAALIAIVIAQILILRKREDAILIAGTFGGLLLAFARTTWSYATITEVYAMNLAFILATVACVLQWQINANARWLYAAAILFGAGLGCHLVTMALILPALVAIAWPVTRTRLFVPLVLSVLLVLSTVYAYEPIASSQKPIIDWGGTSTLSGFIDHVTAKQFRRQINPTQWQMQVTFTRRLLARELGPDIFPIALFAAVYGAWVLWKDSRTLFGFVLLLIAANLAWVLAYPILDDQDAYLLPTIAAVVILAAVSIGEAVRKWGNVAALALAIPLLALIVAWPVRDRSRYDVANRYVANTLQPVRPNALILSNNWNFISPFMYLQPVERVRPDVEVVTVGMLQWPWFLDELARRYPDLMQSVKPHVDAFRPWAAKWVETSDEEWIRRTDWRAEYRGLYNDLIVAMAEDRMRKGRPVYATRDFVVREESDELFPSVAALEQRYDVVPQGMVSHYVPKGSGTRLAPLQFDLTNIKDGGVKWEPGDVMERVIEMYVRSYRMHGRYAFIVTKQPDVAHASYKAAMELKPEDDSIARERDHFEQLSNAR